MIPATAVSLLSVIANVVILMRIKQGKAFAKTNATPSFKNTGTSVIDLASYENATSLSKATISLK